MFTANTMSAAVEALGMGPPGTSSRPAVGRDNRVTDAKRADCRDAVALTFAMIRAGRRSRDILTREAFENAVTTVYALGGSTNAVLHLLAIAHEVSLVAASRAVNYSRVTSRARCRSSS